MEWLESFEARIALMQKKAQESTASRERIRKSFPVAMAKSVYENGEYIMAVQLGEGWRYLPVFAESEVDLWPEVASWLEGQSIIEKP